MRNDKNCGMCGVKTCKEFRKWVANGKRKWDDCIYNADQLSCAGLKQVDYEKTDLHGDVYDFILNPIGNEMSARKIIQPFRPDLVERWDIKKGDVVIGRPMGAGCPVTHSLLVYDVDVISGLLYTWVIGPLEARKLKVIDIKNYYMVGFEGIISHINNYPKIGKMSSFLPSQCMLRLNHRGLVNQIMVLENKDTIVRLENINIS